MIFRELDPTTNDWCFGKGRQNYASGLDALKLDLKTRLLSWTNDCFFSLTDFIDWAGVEESNPYSRFRRAMYYPLYERQLFTEVNSLNRVYWKCILVPQPYHGVATFNFSDFKSIHIFGRTCRFRTSDLHNVNVIFYP